MTDVDPTSDVPKDEAQAKGDTTAAAANASKSEDWLSRPERGALWGIHFMFRLATLFGRTPARLFVRLIAAWYYLFDTNAKTASRQWLSTVFDRPATRKEVYTHLLTFAQVTLDRVFLLQEKYEHFEITCTGDHYLAALQQSSTGAMLLGAHLGSFEAMRAGGQREALDIHILGNFGNARMINALFDRLNDDLRTRVIDVGEDPVHATFLAKEKVEEGAMVAVLADRVANQERAVEVQFFGRTTRLAAGPFLMASMLRCPVYLVFGLYHAPNHYDLYCEPFADMLEFPRKERMQAVQHAAQRYADAVEKYARMAPYCWFNFYDFWEGDGQ